MKAWQITRFGMDGLDLKQIADPKPGHGQVLIKIHAVSLNYRDLLTLRGQYNPKMRLPAIPCSDGAGEIIAVGEDVTSVSTGQRVAGIFMQNWLDGEPTAEKLKGALGGDLSGALAEYIVLSEQGVVPIPEKLSYRQAATLPCAGVTAWKAVVHAGRVQPGDTVLIQGTGGVSIFALQFAKRIGARVLGTSSSDEKLKRAKSLGLDGGVNYRNSPEWSQWVLDQTDGAGVDLTVEVGGSGTFMQSLKATRIGGTIAQIGVLSQSEQPMQIVPILHRQLHIQGIYVGSRSHFEEMNRAIAVNTFEPVIDKVFSFEQAKDAFRMLESGSHFGKIVISFPD